ncbi:MAG: hypothetical protein II819_08175 [Fibrobacter sp.]|nr:hypothetical protein [Fibrobacter sp.]
MANSDSEYKRLEWLCRYLLDENPRYRQMPVPDSLQERRDLFRALMSVRSPMPISEEFLRVQDEELQALLAGKGVVEIAGQAGNDGIEDYRERVSKAGGQMTSC